MYQGHAGSGGLQNHSVGGLYAAGAILVATREGYYGQCVKTGKRTLVLPYDAAHDAALAGEFIRDALPTPYTGGGRACRPSSE